jgi:hypothetical protein
MTAVHDSEKPADSFFALPASDTGQSVRPITASVFCRSVGNQRVFDSGSEASRSPRPHRRLSSGIRPTEQTSWLSFCPYQFPAAWRTGVTDQIRTSSNPQYTLELCEERSGTGRGEDAQPVEGNVKLGPHVALTGPSRGVKPSSTVRAAPRPAVRCGES